MKKQALVFVVTVAIWATAGYLIGNAKGMGWRGAMIHGDNGCRVVCKL